MIPCISVLTLKTRLMLLDASKRWPLPVGRLIKMIVPPIIPMLSGAFSASTETWSGKRHVTLRDQNVLRHTLWSLLPFVFFDTQHWTTSSVSEQSPWGRPVWWTCCTCYSVWGTRSAFVLSLGSCCGFPCLGPAIQYMGISSWGDSRCCSQPFISPGSFSYHCYANDTRLLVPVAFSSRDLSGEL